MKDSLSAWPQVATNFDSFNVKQFNCGGSGLLTKLAVWQNLESGTTRAVKGLKLDEEELELESGQGLRLKLIEDKLVSSLIDSELIETEELLDDDELLGVQLYPSELDDDELLGVHDDDVESELDWELRS